MAMHEELSLIDHNGVIDEVIDYSDIVDNLFLQEGDMKIVFLTVCKYFLNLSIKY